MTTRSLVACAISSILFWGIFAVTAVAHSSGASLERAVGEYVVDIGYEPAEVTAGERLVLDFDIAKRGEGGERVEFDNVWVRLVGDGETLLAAGVARSQIGATTLLYVIPEDISELSIGTRFEKDGEVLANTEFLIPVEARKSAFPFLPVTAAGTLALVAVLIFLVLRSRNPHAKNARV